MKSGGSSKTSYQPKKLVSQKIGKNNLALPLRGAQCLNASARVLKQAIK
jgi:hypothetical protein